MHWFGDDRIAALVLLGVLGAAGAQPPVPKSGDSLTLDDAIHLAQLNEPAFATAAAESRVTALERLDAKAGLLPAVTFHNQYLFTESNHTRAAVPPGESASSLPVFIANN